MATFIWPLLIYWLVMFVACFIVVEVGHDQLYDEVTPHAGLKVAGGSLLIAILLTVYRAKGVPSSFETMFTTNLIWTLLQAIVWAGVFVLIFQFHPWHGLGIGLATMLLVTGLATMGVDSLMKPSPRTTPRAAVSNQPVRHTVSPGGTAAPAPAPAPAPATEKAKAATEKAR